MLSAVDEKLFHAIDAGDLDTLRHILALGGDPNQIWEGETPLLSAARLGRTEHVRLLLAAGADVHVSDSSDCSALHLALNSPCFTLELAQLLLAAGANPNLPDGSGQFPLELIAVRLDAFSRAKRPTEAEFRALASIGLSRESYYESLRAMYGADPRDTERALEQAAGLLCALESAGCH